MKKPATVSPSTETLMLALLGISEKTTLDTLLERSQLTVSQAVEGLCKIKEDGLVTMLDRELRVTNSQRIDLAMALLNMGIDVETVSKAAGWQEFEQLAESLLKAQGYTTRRHFRYSSLNRRHEVDVVALKKPCLLSVECKRWKRSWQPSGIRKIVASHLVRTHSLSEILHDHRETLCLGDWRTTYILPIILMLGETPSRVEKGVPIVPIHRFKDFLIDLDGHLSEFSIFSCEL